MNDHKFPRLYLSGAHTYRHTQTERVRERESRNHNKQCDTIPSGKRFSSHAPQMDTIQKSKDERNIYKKN